MQTLTLNEQEMVAGGRAWVYQPEVDRNDYWDYWGNVGKAIGVGAFTGGVAGAVATIPAGGSGALPGAFGGAFTGYVSYRMNFPAPTVYRQVITIQEWGVNSSSSGSGLLGSRCF